MHRSSCFVSSSPCFKACQRFRPPIGSVCSFSIVITKFVNKQIHSTAPISRPHVFGPNTSPAARSLQTPREYEPIGFEGVKGSTALSFHTKPMQLSVGGRVTTAHHDFSVHVVSSVLPQQDASDYGACEANALSSTASDGAVVYRLDPSRSTASTMPGHSHAAADEPTLLSLYERAHAMVKALEPGSPFSLRHVMSAFDCSRETAETILQRLQTNRLLGPFMPSENARLVAKPRHVGSGQGSQSEASSQESQSSPAAQRASQVSTPSTTACSSKHVSRTEDNNESAHKKRKASATSRVLVSQQASTQPLSAVRESLVDPAPVAPRGLAANVQARSAQGRPSPRGSVIRSMRSSH